MKFVICFAVGCMLTAVAAVSISVIKHKESARLEEEAFWQMHSLEYAEELFEHRAALEREHLFSGEEELVARYFTPEETQRYMRFFIEGYHSNTGTIMLDGELNAPFERAFSRGYQMKRLLIKAYQRGVEEMNQS